MTLPRCPYPCLFRHCHIQNITDAVEVWHSSVEEQGYSKELREVLRMTPAEYANWVEGNLSEDDLAKMGWFEGP